MICFEKLVKNILTEAGEAPKDDPTKLNDEDSKSLQQYIDVKYSTDIQPIYTHYTASNIYTLPSKEELKQIAIIVANNSLRNVKDSDAFPKIKTVYPLLDLFAQLSFIYKRTSGLDATQRQREAQKILDSFKETVSKSSKTPLDYPAINAWAQSVKQEYFSEEKGQIGKLRLESLPKNLSFYGTIKHLLALRSTAMEKSIPLERIPNPKKFIEDIFLNPTFYRDGKSAVPSDKKIQELYNETTSAQLLTVSMASYQLFKQQATMIVGVDDNNNLRITDEHKAYVEYVGGLSDVAQQFAKEFEWSKYVVATESVSVFNFDDLYNNIRKKLIAEAVVDNIKEKSWKVDFDHTKNTINVTQLGIDKSKESDLKFGVIRPIPFTTLADYVKVKYPDTLKKEIKNFASVTKPPMDPKSDTAIIKYIERAIKAQNPDKFPIETEIFTKFLHYEIVKDSSSKVNVSTGYKEPVPVVSNEPEQTQAKPFETAAGSNKFLYSLGNLEKHKQDVPLAGNLYKHLESLANYIVKELEIDWMGAVTKATSALRGLADASPNLGGGGLTG